MPGLDLQEFEFPGLEERGGRIECWLRVRWATKEQRRRRVLELENIENDTVAAIEDADVDATGALSVTATSTAEIKSLGFGIAVSVAISGSARCQK